MATLPKKHRIAAANSPAPTRRVDRRRYSNRWKVVSAAYRKSHPLCNVCKERLATEVDHIQPTIEHTHLFWVSSNWQSICDECHAIKTGRENSQRGRQGGGGSFSTFSTGVRQDG